MSVEAKSPEARLSAAGFSRSAHLWVAPGNKGVMSQEDAIAALDSSEFPPTLTFTVPDGGVRALPDELVERMFATPPPEVPAWLLEQLAEHLRPTIKAEVRAALRRARKP